MPSEKAYVYYVGFQVDLELKQRIKREAVAAKLSIASYIRWVLNNYYSKQDKELKDE